MQKSNFMKIRPEGEKKSFYAEGQTDMRKQLVAFRIFAKAPKMHNKRFKLCTWSPPNGANTA